MTIKTLISNYSNFYNFNFFVIALFQFSEIDILVQSHFLILKQKMACR